MVAGPFPVVPGSPGGAFGIVYVNGEPVRLWELTPEERAKVYQQLEQEATQNTIQTPVEERAPEDQAKAFQSEAQDRGFVTSVENASIQSLLEGAGVDMDDPEVQFFVQNFGDQLSDPETGPLMIQQLAQKHPAVPVTQYQQALQESGFGDTYGGPGGALWEAGAATGVPAAISGRDAQSAKFDTQPDTGWTRFANGVLVSADGQIIFDPASKAPGSQPWLRDVVSQWGDEKIAEWRKRLNEFGYLTKDQAKVKGIDTVFQNALVAYHTQRYVNGGKPVAGDLAGTGAAGGHADQPLLDYNDMSGQIRNDVREQYQRVFGTEPTDGEVAAWSDYIIHHGMDLQRKFRGKDYGSYQTMAATEAEERFVTQLEQSPEAKFLRDSTEENTKLHDALQRAVQVTNSLAG